MSHMFDTELDSLRAISMICINKITFREHHKEIIWLKKISPQGTFIELLNMLFGYFKFAMY